MSDKRQYWREKTAKALLQVSKQLKAIHFDRPDDPISPALAAMLADKCPFEPYVNSTWLEAILLSQLKIAISGGKDSVRAFEAIANRIAGKPTEYKSTRSQEAIAMVVKQLEPAQRVVEASNQPDPVELMPIQNPSAHRISMHEPRLSTLESVNET